jgi:hypothetical protein
MILTLAALVCILGVLMYALSTNGKVQAIGKDMFWVGLLVFLANSGSINGIHIGR